MKLTAAIAAAVFCLAGSARAEGAKRFLLGFKPGVSAAERASALAALKGLDPAVREISGFNKTGPQFHAWVVASTASVPGAFRVEEDVRLKWIEGEPGAPLPSFDAVMEGLPKLQAQLLPGWQFIPWGVRRVNAPAAWPVTEGRGVKVGIVDTGIDARNPALDGKVLGGYNALLSSALEQDTRDDNGHGTHVAGTIAAARGSGFGVVGVAPEASLYAVKVLDKDGSGTMSSVIDGIIWCINNKMQVINMSLGGPVDSGMLHEAVQYAEGMGVVVVAAAGNSGGATGYPAAYPEALSVSASTPNDKLAAFSSRGKVDFIAPGAFIVSLAPGREIANMSGTSMAAPHVTGLAALAISMGARGLQGPDGVAEALRKAATPLPGLSAAEQGAGLIDAGKLIP